MRREALVEPTSALIVSAERSLRAEFPTEAQAGDVLSEIGSEAVTFTDIARAGGGLSQVAVARGVDVLGAKRMVARDLPLSTRRSREARYRVTDPYLLFWLRFIGPHLPEIERGRSDRVLDRIRDNWTTGRGRAVEPIIHEALSRLLPIEGSLTHRSSGATGPDPMTRRSTSSLRTGRRPPRRLRSPGPSSGATTPSSNSRTWRSSSPTRPRSQGQTSRRHASRCLETA